METPRNPTSLRLPLWIREVLAEQAEREHRTWQMQLIHVLSEALADEWECRVRDEAAA
jgi:hypothetical protein